MRIPRSQLFLAQDDWARAFEWVWERKPRCCKCRRLIRPAQWVMWLESGQPDSLAHLGCLPPKVRQMAQAELRMRAQEQSAYDAARAMRRVLGKE